MTLTQAILTACLFAGEDAGPDAARSWLDRDRCPPQVQLRALGSVTSAPRDWKILRAHFQKYGQCDDGAIAEGYSHDVVTLLAREWKLIDELAGLGRSDPTFLRFVVTHIDVTAADEDLRQVLARAQAACPPGRGKLCRRIAERARKALDQHGAPQPQPR